MSDERQTLDRLLKRADLARRRADELSPAAPLAERLCVIVDLRQSLQALGKNHAALEKRRARAARGRTVATAYGRAAALGPSPR
jgi:hypothetical protein